MPPPDDHAIPLGLTLQLFPAAPAGPYQSTSIRNSCVGGRRQRHRPQRGILLPLKQETRSHRALD